MFTMIERTDEMMLDLYLDLCTKKDPRTSLKVKDLLVGFREWTADRDHICSITRTEFLQLLEVRGYPVYKEKNVIVAYGLKWDLGEF